MLTILMGAVIAFTVILPLVMARFSRELPFGVRVFLVVVAASPLATMPLLNNALQVGNWVGNRGAPIPPEVKMVFLPALVCAVGGIVTFLYGLWRGGATAVAGLLALVAAFVEYLAFGLVIALKHVS